MPSPGRNDACPCGSGKKFKQCCALKQDRMSPGAHRGARSPVAVLTVDRHRHGRAAVVQLWAGVVARHTGTITMRRDAKSRADLRAGPIDARAGAVSETWRRPCSWDRRCWRCALAALRHDLVRLHLLEAVLVDQPLDELDLRDAQGIDERTHAARDHDVRRRLRCAASGCAVPLIRSNWKVTSAVVSRPEPAISPSPCSAWTSPK